MAVFDRLAGYLVLAQVKWLIEPDSFQDESHAREDISKGIVQLSNVADLFTDSKDWVIAQIFPNAEVASDDVKEVNYFLISHGNVTSVIEVPSPRISMLDYQLSFDALRDTETLPLKERFGRVLQLHDEIRQISATNVGYNRFKIGGYICATLGHKVSEQDSVYRRDFGSSLDKKAPCLCGSGKRYGDCCQILEQPKEPTELG